MAQTKKKVATKTAAKSAGAAKKPCCSKKACQKQDKPANNTFFVISMSFLAATLLFADLMMMSM